MSIHTINYFGSRNRATLPSDLPNPPRIVTRNLELDDWGRDPRIRGKQDLIAARFEADGLDWNWRHIAEQSMTALEPGGWLELQMVGPLTSDDGSADGTALGAIPRHLSRTSFGSRGEEKTAAGHAAVLAEAGFDEVTVVRRKWWSTPVRHRTDVDDVEVRLAGMYISEVEAAQLLEAQCDEISTYLRWTPEQARRFLLKAKAEIRDPSIQAYFPVYVSPLPPLFPVFQILGVSFLVLTRSLVRSVIYGRKPFA